MTTPYTAQQPVTEFSLRFSDLIWAVTLGANAEQHFTVPGGAPRYKASIVIPAGNAVWVAYNKTASVGPALIAQHNSELVSLSYCREVNAGDVLSFISANASAISVAFYAVGTNN